MGLAQHLWDRLLKVSWWRAGKTKALWGGMYLYELGCLVGVGCQVVDGEAQGTGCSLIATLRQSLSGRPIMFP